MSEIDTGGPAFPGDTATGYVQIDVSGISHAVTEPHQGMTLRDYFAAHAPEPPESWHGGARKIADLIAWRWSYADYMLKEREA